MASEWREAVCLEGPESGSRLLPSLFAWIRLKLFSIAGFCGDEWVLIYQVH